ncbi:MAG TPA: glycosyltransferase family 4 protein [Acidimicrobiales bacterium]|nr:glycosyltransferase family 4 protein [Acidimicrobiales bacterium]
MAARSVVHVIPTAVARGAQVYARALVDALDGPGTHHRLLCLFEGFEDVVVDEHLGCRTLGEPGAGFDPRVVGRLRSNLARSKPSAVVAHGGDALKYVAPVGLLDRGPKRVPVAYYAIGTLADTARHGTRLRLWRAMVARADVVAAVSDDVADECRQVLAVQPARLDVVPNGRDQEVFHPPGDGPPRQVPLVVFVGRLVPAKRPDRFVALVAALRDRGLALDAAIVGDGPQRGALEGPAAAAGVELVGRVDDVAGRLRGADLLVLPSRPAGEGMPGVLIEAGLSGVPVVTTAVPGASTVVEPGHTGEVVPVDDFEALASATAGLVSDPVRRRVMGTAARARCVERFTMTASARVWKRVLDRLTTGDFAR